MRCPFSFFYARIEEEIMRSHRLVRRMVGLVLLGMICGCGTSDPSGRRAISGAVTLDGAPLEQGSISLQPADGAKYSSGAVISKGRYTIPKDKGLPPGKYRVVISAVKPGTGLTLPRERCRQEVGVPRRACPAQWNTNSNQFIEIDFGRRSSRTRSCQRRSRR